MKFTESSGFKRFKKNLDDTSVKVGWFEDAKYDDGTSIAMIAATQEFGSISRGIPARPFMQPTIEEKGKKWVEELDGQLVGVMKEQISLEGAFKNIGQVIKDNLIEKIQSITTPELNPATVEARAKRRFRTNKKGTQTNLRLKKDQTLGEAMAGLNKPLIDTGKMIRSIKFKVETKKVKRYI